MAPLWSVAASFLGWSTAALSTEAAMACTEAVETVIGEHYNGQLAMLERMVAAKKQRGEEVGSDLKQLMERIKVIRDEELEHLDTAVEEGAQQAEAYPLLSGAIRAGCRGAIWISERV
jgi:ubiquinone biosynthesis monooxygenase Coq7